MMYKFIIALIFLFYSQISFAFNDIITLNNNMSFQGKVTKIKNCEVSFKVDGEKYSIPSSEIFSIEFANINNKTYTNYLKISENEPDNCLNGTLDAEFYHRKKGGHFVLGVLFGPFAMIGTALANPTPDRGRNTYSMSNNKDLFTDPQYISCYKKKAKTQLITAEALGWAAWILIILSAG